jgi:hypothetical protein
LSHWCLRVNLDHIETVLGAMRALQGFLTGGNTEMYAKSAGMNSNLIWGVVMLVTGLIFLALAKRGAAT